MKSEKPNGKALLPILLFLLLYLGNGIYFEYIHPIEGQMGFYIMSVVLAFSIALAVALIQNRGYDSVSAYSDGATPKCLRKMVEKWARLENPTV